MTSHPQARRRYDQREAIVESVFSQLRGQQGLGNFRRTSLSAVNVEFKVHIMAYNLSQIVVYTLKRSFEGGTRALDGEIGDCGAN